MATEPAYGWGANAAGGPPFLLTHIFSGRKEAIAWMLETYGSQPSREAALKRLRREGIRAVRVKLLPFRTKGGGA